MASPSETADSRWLFEVSARLSDLGDVTDEYVTAQVAMQFASAGLPGDRELHDAVGRAHVVRAMQSSFA
jgi:hypothetical protein